MAREGIKASAIAIIGMPSSARHAIGKARDARTQGIGMPSSASSASARHAIGKARTQGTQGRKVSACHHHRHAVKGMPSRHHRHRHAIGIIIGNCHRHRHAIIGMPSASASAAAGRRTAGRSTVAQYSHTDFSRVFRCAVMEIF